MNGGGRLLDGELRLAGRLDARFFALLQAVHDTGSINKAARTAGYSYKGAWLVLEAAGNLSTEPLLSTATQGTRLTPAALALLDAWQRLQRAHARFLQEQDQALAAMPALQGLLRRMSMRTSARNQFAGTVSAVAEGPVSTEVTITLPGGSAITAALSSSAARRMKLRRGQEALALVKAPFVVLVTDFAGWRLSASNQLEGTVSRIERGAVSTLVSLTLPGGAVLTASITNEALEALALRVGQPATAVFKASAVMVATQG